MKKFWFGFISGALVFFLFGLMMSNHVILLRGKNLDMRSAEMALSKRFEQEVDFSRLIQVMAALKSNYYLPEGEDFDVEKMMDQAVVGLVKGLDDKHSVYMLPEETKAFQDSLNGDLEGIGAELRKSEKIIEVVSVLKGTPAESVGLLPGDFIVEVDGEDISSMLFYEVIRMIRGEKGTVVKIGVMRDGERIDFDITRDKIKIESVETSMDGNIGIVEINNFGTKTSLDFANALYEMEKKNVEGLVIDLRYNPGGVLIGAVDMIARFFPKDQLIVSRRSHEMNDEYRGFNPTIFEELPVVLLVNKGSASASEIFAGAFQDLMRGKVIGEDTYGKGSVQEPFSYSDDRLLKITTARWYTPLGRNIDETGIKPDVFVERTKEDIEEDKDPQLEKALEVLRSGDWRQTEPPELGSGSLVVGSGEVLELMEDEIVEEVITSEVNQ